MGRIPLRLASVLSFALLASACGGGENAPYADDISKVTETDAQTAPAGGRLSQPLAVVVRNTVGNTMPRVRVRWRITPGGGTVSDSVTLTDGNGRAEVDLITGSTPGALTVRAELALNVARFVSFNVTAAAPPTLSSVAPAQFTGGDQVTVQGTGLGPSLAFEVNGAPARLVAATATTASFVVPGCLPGGAVTLRARFNGGATNSLPGTYTASTNPLALAAGDYALIDPGQVASCATFPPAGAGGAEYLVAPQSAATTPGLTGAYRLASDATAPSAPEPGRAVRPANSAERFHDFMRRRETELAATGLREPLPPRTVTAAAAATVPIQLNSERDFRVCAKLDCNLLNDFTRIHVRARFVGEHIAIYQDVAAPANGFTDADFESLGRTFDDVMYDVASRAFGAESDIDANGVVSVVMTPVVNQLTPADQCGIAIVTGFFYAIDLDPAFTADQRANPGENFYSLVPDPAGTARCPLTKDRVVRIVPGTFIHEFQHMINHYQHVLVRGRPAEQLWLNEGMSHLAEELGALAFREAGDQVMFSDLVVGNLFDGYQYLRNPGSYFTLFDEGAGTLAERGASWLFLRWLTDKFGTSLPRRLSESGFRGADNISRATGEPFARLIGEWFLANYASDLPGVTVPDRLTYDSWSFRTTFASLNQQIPARFDRPFPLEPQVFQGTTISIDGTLRAGSGGYYRIVQAPNQAGFTLRFTTPTGADFAASLAGRLNVLRIR